AADPPGGGPPALQTSRSPPPRAGAPASMNAARLAASATSASNACTSPPVSAAMASAASCARGNDREQSATRAPSRASPSATARPRPLLAARTRARFPLSSSSITGHLQSAVCRGSRVLCSPWWLSPSHVPVLFEHFSCCHSFCAEFAGFLFLPDNFFCPFQDLSDEAVRYDDDAVFVTEHEIVRRHGYRQAERARQFDRFAVGCDPPAAHGLHRCDPAGKHGETGGGNVLNVTEATIDNSAVAAAFLHGGGDEVPEQADAAGVRTAPDAHGTFRKGVDDIEFQAVRTFFVHEATFDGKCP